MHRSKLTRHQDPVRLMRITTIPISLRVLLKGQMRYFSTTGMEVLMVSGAGDGIPELVEQEGVPHQVVALTRSVQPINDLKALWQLYRAIRRFRPHIVHTHTPKAGLLGMMAAACAFVPIRIHTVAGVPWMHSRGIARFIFRQMERLTARCAHVVLANSLQLRGWLIDQGLLAEKLHVLGQGTSNGISISQYTTTNELKLGAVELRRKYKVVDGGWVWIFIGRLVTHKGLVELIEAFEAFSVHYPEDQLWLLGDYEHDRDPLPPSIQKRIQDGKGIRAMGFVADVRPYLVAAESLVFPSWREGFPNVPLQAGLLGCYLILSNINGCREILSDQLPGTLVDIQSKQAILDAMLNARTLSDSERQAFASLVRQSIIERFSQEKLWEALEHLYQSKLSAILN